MDKTLIYDNDGKDSMPAENGVQDYAIDSSFIYSAEYSVIKKIAEGGMGAVYKVLKSGTCGFEKVVAVKTMNTSLAKDSKYTRMFIEEAKLVAKLDHENIVSLNQLGVTGSDCYFFELEFINGISLYDFFHHHELVRKSIPPELAVFIISRIARGLAYAHSRYDSEGNFIGIVHRDVCPRNVLINCEGVPKLTDFGIAVAREATSSSALPGKPIFMSPEQACQEPVDYRSDIYSLGAVFFLLLAGDTSRKCYTDDAKILDKARSGSVEWDRLPEELDVTLVEILKKMLAADRVDRYSSTESLAQDLEYYIYKDGYGPTIKTLADYMADEMPSLILEGEESSECRAVSDLIHNVYDAKTSIM